MKLLFRIALRQILARKRQSIVSILGVIIGVAFFLAISSLMRGSEKDFIRRLVDNSPHITVKDEYRNPKKQPVERKYIDGAVRIRNLRIVSDNRGILNYQRILGDARRLPGAEATGMLLGQVIVSATGKDLGATFNGVVPNEMLGVSSIEQHMKRGTILDLERDMQGIIVGTELMRQLVVDIGDVVRVAVPDGSTKNFNIVGEFRTGRSDFDRGQVFVNIKQAQALLNRGRRVNSVIVRLADPYTAFDEATKLERLYHYKSVSWQESSEDILNALTIRNIIMYTVVSSVLIVAAFGVYNVISTIVLEKRRDIAILKSLGFRAREIQKIFVFQGIVLGVCGCILGLPFGCLLMYALMQIQFKPPGGSETISMPIDWSAFQFVIAAGFALFSAILASSLPARKAGKVEPVAILRGGW